MRIGDQFWIPRRPGAREDQGANGMILRLKDAARWNTIDSIYLKQQTVRLPFISVHYPSTRFESLHDLFMRRLCICRGHSELRAVETDQRQHRKQMLVCIRNNDANPVAFLDAAFTHPILRSSNVAEKVRVRYRSMIEMNSDSIRMTIERFEQGFDQISHFAPREVMYIG